jgi:uncharacterized protein YecE (DUF72 family)
MNRSSVNNFYSGTSGIVVPVTQALYPDAFKGKSRLTYYASFFNSIEINSSFYKLPQAFTVVKWCKMVPEDFQFTFKLSKSISHSKNLDFNADELTLFMETINNVDEKKGCILLQFPPSLKLENLKQLKELFKMINAINAQAWKIAVEFRNKVWYNEQTFRLLKDYNISLVLHDLPASATPLSAPLNNIVYLRFHGTERGYRGNYNNEILLAYAKHINKWIEEGKCVYCYFNNTLGNAFDNLKTLNQLVISL